MSFEKFYKKLSSTNLSPSFGVVKKVTSSTIIVSGLNPSIGDIVKIVSSVDSEQQTLAMVTEIDDQHFFVSPFSFVEGYRVGDKVYLNNKGMQIPVGNSLLGRVVDPFMNPIDDGPEIEPEDFYSMNRPPISAMKRGIINEKFTVGVKTIDGLLTCGKGQKLGIFAGSGVGKSTLMGMIVRGCEAPIKVIALIGERGREVPEFIENNLNGDLTNTVLIVATSDDSPLMRKYGAFAAMSVAEYFKDQGQDVLFMMDSVTRFAMAQREIGLALGEPPTSKGYPPSTLALLPQLMERAGKEKGKGSITAFFTVLVDGDDMSDPIADQSRSILDGHFVLSRELTDFGIYPPVNILNSASRVMNEVVEPQQTKAAIKFRRMYAMLKENEAVIRMGAYEKGSDKELDEAIEKKQDIDDFMKQDQRDKIAYEDTLNKLNVIVL
jgi:flagellum-specific ATP synthase